MNYGDVIFDLCGIVFGWLIKLEDKNNYVIGYNIIIMLLCVFLWKI